jgi:hypothetical protein
MTDLRKAAEDALKVLEELHGGCTDSDDGSVECLTIWVPEVITALRAALAEPEPAKPAEIVEVTDLELKKMIGAALMVPPTDNWHYPLSENQLRHLIARAVEAEREAILTASLRHPTP